MSVLAVSHSSINCYDTCPYQYRAKYVTKEVRFTQSAEAKWGDDVHNALEAYGKSGRPLPTNMLHYKPYIDAVLARPGEKIFEGACAIDIDGNKCSYWEKDATGGNKVWIRAKIDVLNLRFDLRRAEIFDWKTGKTPKDDPEQMMMYAMFVFLFYPDIDEVRTGFSWLKQPLHEAFTTPRTFYRRQLSELMAYFRRKHGDIEHAIEVDAFPKKQSGLCNGWCDVKSCEYSKPKKG